MASKAVESAAGTATALEGHRTNQETVSGQFLSVGEHADTRIVAVNLTMACFAGKIAAADREESNHRKDGLNYTKHRQRLETAGIRHEQK